MNTIGFIIIYVACVLTTLFFLCKSFENDTRIGKRISVMLALAAIDCAIYVIALIISTELPTSIIQSIQMSIGAWLFVILYDMSLNINLKYESSGEKIALIVMLVLVIGDAVLLVLNPMNQWMFEFRTVSMEGKLFFTMIKHVPIAIHYIILFFITAFAIYSTAERKKKDSVANAKKYDAVFYIYTIIAINALMYLLFSYVGPDISSIIYCGCAIILYLIHGNTGMYILRMFSRNDMLDRLGAMVVMFDADGFLFDFSSKAGEILNFNKDYIGVLDENMFVDGRLGMDADYLIDGTTVELMLMVENERRCYNFDFHRLTDDKGHKIGSIYVLHDITSLQNMYSDIEEEMICDPITGMYDEEVLEVKLREFDSPEYMPVCIAVMDINGLSIVNDMMGVSEGDRMLKFCNEVLKTQLRIEDFTAVSNCETVIIMPGFTEAQAMGRMSFVKEIISYQVDFPIFLSIEYGVAEKNNDSVMLADVLGAARNAMRCKKMLNPYSSHSFIVKELNEHVDVLGISSIERRKRICKNAVMVAEKMNLSDENISEIELLAALYEVGKLTLSDSILCKKDALTDKEREDVRMIPLKGFYILNSNKALNKISSYLLAQRENWDGSGYPYGLSGEDIPIQSRIVSLVSAYELITNGTVYSSARSEEEAVDELLRCSGTQFDPDIVKIFINEIHNKEIIGAEREFIENMFPEGIN